MIEILLCSHNPLLIKNLYGIIRDEGYAVEIVDHPTLAVQKFMQKNYAFIIFDSGSFGLTAGEAVQIIRSLSSDIPILILGSTECSVSAEGLPIPLNLEEFKQSIHDIHRLSSLNNP